MNEAARYVRSLGLSWSGPLPSSPYKMAKIVDLAGHSVLDVGCADGRYVAFCHRIGKQAQGVDLDRTRLERAISDFGRFFSRAFADTLPFADKSFDTVAMWDVLEHTKDDQSALSEAIRIARLNVLLSIPKEHSEQVFTVTNGLTYRHYIDPEHKRYYTPASIEALVNRLGSYRLAIEHWCRIYPVAVYKGIGIPRLLTAGLDRLFWLLGRDRNAFMRNLFVEIAVG